MLDTYNYYSAFAGIPDWQHLVKLSVEVESTPRNNDMATQRLSKSGKGFTAQCKLEPSICQSAK